MKELNLRTPSALAMGVCQYVYAILIFLGNIMRIFEKIYMEVKKIKKGTTKTYGQIAKKVGTSARVVGFALHKNPDPKNIPCHRVIFKDGSLSNSYAFGGKKAQEKKLKEEKALK